ncbi:hypothetical protein [Methanoculleus chikugoensis]|uniref:hypothetical protein n=1 Tax=Methanoculleus chikugoensis TaxID=118126 RepID=UPI0006D06AD5|nr:hypothetical protein [Methanoculleus chikugoensis]
MPVPDLFYAMMKEEWRMHSTIFGSLGFALFPAVIAVFAFLGSLTLPIFADVFPYDVVALLIHALFLLMGVMVGSFGLMGREFMNRRFGQASLIAYASRSLPVSERRIFAAFLIKDTVYYILLYVLPFAAGFTAATPFTGLDPALGLLAFVSLALAFLLGLSAVCFLSTLYARSVALLAGTAAVLAVAALAAFRLGAMTISTVLPPPMPSSSTPPPWNRSRSRSSSSWCRRPHPLSSSPSITRTGRSGLPTASILSRGGDSAVSGARTSSRRTPSTSSGAKAVPGR